MKIILPVLMLISLNSYAQVDILNYWSKGINLSDNATAEDLKDWDVDKKKNQKIYTSNKEFRIDEHGGYSHSIEKGKQKIILEKKDGKTRSLSQMYLASESVEGKSSKVIFAKKVKYDQDGKLDYYSHCSNKGGLATCATVNKFYCELLLKSFGNVLPNKEKVTNIKACVKELNTFSQAISLAKTNRNDGIDFNELISNGESITNEIKTNLKTPVLNLERNFEDLASIENKAQDLLKLSSACKEFFELSNHSYSTVNKIIKDMSGANKQ